MSLPLRAYPAQFIASHALDGGAWAVLRPVRAEDRPMIAALLTGLSPVSRYQRHFSHGVAADLALIERLAGADYEHVLGLLAVTVEDGVETAVGLAEYAATGDEAEFALLIADRWQRRGLGSRLLAALADCAAAAGVREISGYALAVNTGVQKLALRQGFRIERTADATVLRLVRSLDADARASVMTAGHWPARASLTAAPPA